MEINIHVHHHFDPIETNPPGSSGFDRILAAIEEMNVSLQEKLNAALAEANEMSSAVDSVLTVLGGVKGQLEAVLAGEGTLDEVIASLNESQARIAAAIVTNTPADPEAPPSEDPPV